jgi:DNA-binding NarL/FixJ family response regulator
MSIFDINSENIKLTVLEENYDTLIDDNCYVEIRVSKEFLKNSVINLALFKDTSKPTNIHLTQRETEALKYVAQGKNNTEIARIMNISVHTVKAYVHNILDKLYSYDRTEAVVKAIKHNLLDVYELE